MFVSKRTSSDSRNCLESSATQRECLSLSVVALAVDYWNPCPAITQEKFVETTFGGVLKERWATSLNARIPSFGEKSKVGGDVALLINDLYRMNLHFGLGRRTSQDMKETPHQCTAISKVLNYIFVNFRLSANYFLFCNRRLLTRKQNGVVGAS